MSIVFFKGLLNVMSWASLCEQAGFNAALADRVKNRLANCKDEMASVCLREGAERKPSPLKFFANSIGHLPTKGEAELQKRLEHYLCTMKEATSSKTYINILHELAEEAGDEIISWLNPSQESIFRKIGIFTFLEIEGETLLSRLSELVENIFFAEKIFQLENHEGKFRGLFCQKPFEYAQVESSGRVFLCCPQHIQVPAGDISQCNFMEVWNSENARAIRKSIIDGSFKYCSEATCGLLQNRNLPKVEDADPHYRQIIQDGITRLNRGPRTINFSYDRSCNLSCPSCRSNFFVLKGKAKQRVELIHKRIIASHIKDAHHLIITGSGDPFGSQIYFSFLKEFEPRTAPDLRIQLSTNGLLFTEKRWKMICREAVDMVDVSVDAANAKTYRLNRGGDYDKLLANLQLIGELRTKGELQFFSLHFVVQANNFMEMRDFVKLAQEVYCDSVCFKQLINWGTYSEEDYLNRAVQLPIHPRHRDFLVVLSDPIFKLPLVYMHDLSHLFEDENA